jgi:rare lipoprotein A
MKILLYRNRSYSLAGRLGRLLKVFAVISSFSLAVLSCSVVSTTYDITKGTVKATYNTAKYTTKATIGTTKMVYKVGKFTFEVVMAPLDWPMTQDIESIGGLSPMEAVRQGKVKRAPYVVRGRKYYPMTVKQAANYREVGTASWYGNETLRQKGGHMTANGEAFDPGKPTAAHKLLPLPTHVRVTNLENGRSMILRVNDRGPFVKGRIIDLSAGAAKQLGFYRNGTARVRVETVEL